MSNPLSPVSQSSLNALAVPAEFDVKNGADSHRSPSSTASAKQADAANPQRNDPPSSPFQTEVSTTADKENVSQHSSQPSLKLGKSSTPNFEIHDEEASTNHETITVDFSPLKSQASTRSSPLKRSPLKEVGDETLSNMREKVFRSMTNSEPNTVAGGSEEVDEHDNRSVVSDDTCFSNFSAVPNVDMTLFAALGARGADKTSRSPSRRFHHGQTPTQHAFFTPRTSHRKQAPERSPSPTPRQNNAKPSDNDTTSLLLDFTQQFDATSNLSHHQPTLGGRGSPMKSSTQPNLLSYISSQRKPSPTKPTPRTPGGKRDLLNLLDFDLPPQPTPRSIPSITVRELESLKSTYLSEISSLKASLSGKDAEVESLKKAVNDAERRVGEALENVREEKSAREHAEKEKSDWEKKGQEVECLLRNVKEEFLYAEKEKEELLQKLEESNRLKEDAEMKVEEAATKATVAKSDVNARDGQSQSIGQLSEDEIAKRVAQQLDEKMENLARELHAVYKKKHESKVATLKKTYESRAEKRCNELQKTIDELTKQNEELQISKESTFSGELPSDFRKTAEHDRVEEQNAELQEQKAKLAGLAEELKSIQSSHDQLLQDLERERVEKGELVAAVDEMLALQSEVGAPAAVEDFRKSISRPPSAIKGPGFGAPSGLARSSASSGKSRMMSNIERMGGGRAAE